MQLKCYFLDMLYCIYDCLLAVVSLIDEELSNGKIQLCSSKISLFGFLNVGLFLDPFTDPLKSGSGHFL